MGKKYKARSVNDAVSHNKKFATAVHKDLLKLEAASAKVINSLTLLIDETETYIDERLTKSLENNLRLIEGIDGQIERVQNQLDSTLSKIK